MKKLTLIVFMTFLSVQSFAALLNLSGKVYRSMEFDFSANGLEFSANGNLVIEIEDTSGQTESHLLQYNKSINLKRKDIRRVTIYAP